jgi:hypothetical protein
MSDHEKPAMTEDEIEMLVWELETAIRQRDPRAPLSAELTMLAEMRSHWDERDAVMVAKRAAAVAKIEADFEAAMAAAKRLITRALQ